MAETGAEVDIDQLLVALERARLPTGGAFGGEPLVEDVLGFQAAIGGWLIQAARVVFDDVLDGE